MRLTFFFVASAVVLGLQSVAAEGPVTGPLSAWTPPLPCQGMFTDVPCGSQFDTWVEQFARDGITSGCSAGHYCPDTAVTRRQMAVFVERSMRGASGWPAHTVLVVHHPAGETSSDVSSGTELLALVAAIPSTGSEAPSATNPWLIRVGPGIFDLGSGSLTLPVYTAIEGAGEDVTTIVASGYASQTAGTIICSAHSQARLLTVINRGGGAYANGISVANSATNVRLYRLTVDVSQPSNATTNQTYGIWAGTNTQMLLTDVTISAHGGYNNFGLYASATSQTNALDHVTITATNSNSSGVAQGVVCAGAPVLITDSSINASSGTYAQGIEVDSGVEWTMQSSRVSATSTTYPIGIWDMANITHLQDVFVTSEGTGIALTACGVATCSAEILNSRFISISWAVDNGASFSTLVAASRLIGNTVNTGGTLNCMGNYTTTTFYASTCP
jgi:hypothetical protein